MSMRDKVRMTAGEVSEYLRGPHTLNVATIELCPRCLLRDDVASHLVFVPADQQPPEPRREEPTEPEPDAAGAELG